MLDLLAFKATDVPAENIVKNGNFADGENEWRFSETDLRLVDNGILSFTATGNANSQSRQNLFQLFTVNDMNLEEGQKYYISADLFADTSVILAMSTVEVARVSKPYEWERLSGTYVFETVYGQSRPFGISDTKSSNWTETKVKNFIFIDLTKTFGLGNEPTTKQMDMLLEQFPSSWFDGTENLFNAKEFMNIYHKKMTELDNAITALGGSG